MHTQCEIKAGNFTEELNELAETDDYKYFCPSCRSKKQTKAPINDSQSSGTPSKNELEDQAITSLSMQSNSSSTSDFKYNFDDKVEDAVKPISRHHDW